MKKNILLVYAYSNYPMRITLWEHLRAFAQYSDERVLYLDLMSKDLPGSREQFDNTRWYLKNIPDYVLNIDYDLIIFHTLFMARHWAGREHFRRLMERVEPLKQLPAIKVILPQDEFILSDLICEFINEMDIDCVFSVAPETEWPNIYRSVNFDQVKFYNVLTGYLDEKKQKKIASFGSNLPARPIDIGYRTSAKPYFWFGRHGFLKNEIAEAFKEKAPHKGLVIDISTRRGDAILGDDWYKFLANCKYTIGVEGGTSLLDRDGSIRVRTEGYLKQHPQAPFEEVEEACFPNTDGNCRLYVISPRHLENCATRTCQVLTEGDYNGILKPGVHYIELKKDFSNIDQVLETVFQDRLRVEMVERAYQDIVASGKYTYRRFVEFVIQQALDGVIPRSNQRRMHTWLREQVVYYYMRWVEWREWLWFRIYPCFARPTWFSAYWTYRRLRTQAGRFLRSVKEVLCSRIAT